MSTTRSPIRRRLLISAATNWLAFAAALLTAFFLAPYLISKIGDARYGVWGFVESILAYFTLFDLGVAACLLRFVARHHAQKDQAELNRTVSAGLAVFVVAGLAVLLVGLALVPILQPTIARKAPQADDAGLFLVVMVATVAATLPLSAFPSILDGLERYALKSLVRVIFLGLRVAGFVWVCETNPSLLGLGLVYAAAHLSEHAVCALLCFRLMPGLRISPRLIDRPTLRRVRGYSTDAFLAMFASRVSMQSTSIVVGIFLAFSQVTYFLLAFRLVEIAKSMLRHITTTLTPAISSLEAVGDEAAIRRILLTATRWVLYLILPVQVGMWFFGKPFFTEWLDDARYGEECYPTLAILAATLTLAIAQSVCARVLYGTGRLRVFSRLLLVEAGVSLALSLLLVRPMGITGVALAVTLPNAVGCAVTIGYTCGVLGISIAEYLRKACLKPLVLSAIPTAVWLATVDTGSLSGWSAIIAAGAIGLAPYAVVVASVEFRWRELLSRGLDRFAASRVRDGRALNEVKP